MRRTPPTRRDPPAHGSRTRRGSRQFTLYTARVAATVVVLRAVPQTEAARRCGVTQPRMNDLLRGRVSRFSLDALVNIAAAIGRAVHIELQAT